ncbi:MAG: sensor histidine kinase, partial [Candidatus Acidiferrum sp.]
HLIAGLPGVAWLPLIIQPGGNVSLWDARWERLTGLSLGDLAGMRTELVLDWLFPLQRDRNRVADWLHDPRRQGGQSVLQVLTRSGSRPLLCTLLLAQRSETGEGGEQWLLLAGESELFAGPGTPSLGFVRQFTRGLGQLLNHYFSLPVGLAEMALDRADLPVEVSEWFQRILDSCQRATCLLIGLEDLSTVSIGEAAPVELAQFLREFLGESGNQSRPACELRIDLPDNCCKVRVNRRLIRTVLGHLLRNARQALMDGPHGRIQMPVYEREETLRCEIQDNGEGLPSGDCSQVLQAFFSTKGAFARDATHAAQEAVGLGLTVCQHLLALHGGHLEIRGAPGEGTTATMVLPAYSDPEAASDAVSMDTARVDASARTRGPHGRPNRVAAPERPAE